jgi:hypothetical protein
MNDRELMRAHIEALFTLDRNGRMLRINDPRGNRAPRFFLGRTAVGNEWRFRDDIDETLRTELESLCIADITSAASYEEVLRRFAPVQGTEAGPAYRFPDDLPSSSAVRVTEENRDVLRPHLEGWLGDVRPENIMCASLVDGLAVSVCCSVRVTSVAHEAGVETVPEFRGQGHALQVVSAWARAMRGAGRTPLYSTSWQNVASQAVARALRLTMYGSDLHIT